MHLQFLGSFTAAPLLPAVLPRSVLIPSRLMQHWRHHRTKLLLRSTSRLAFLLLAATIHCHWVAAADRLSRREIDLFENEVRPTLVAHCIKCHGAKKQEGGLKLTSLADVLRGGDSGPAVVPGNPEESLIIEAMRYEGLEMPPDSQLHGDKVVGLVRWVSAGAPWPEDVVLSETPFITDDDRQWWCYQPLAVAAPPVVESVWPNNEIDSFVFKQMAKHRIEPASRATNSELARRVSFAITGLPPGNETISAAQSESFNFDALVERLLQSEAYGENQARFWLDLVRYADSDGYRADHARPDAFEYRDYVIRSFNADMPYHRFIRQQLAGDEVEPGNRDAIIATMYLRHWIYEHNQRDVETQWHEILSDITETTADVFLAQGIKCARCHDHKFDPLLQNDYFRLKAFFAALNPVAEHPVADVETRAEYDRQLRKWENATEEIRGRLREIEYPVALEHATREGFDKFIPEIQEMIRTPRREREPYQQQIASMAERQFDLPYDKLDEWLNEDQIQARKRLKQELKSLEYLKPKQLQTVKFVATDVGPDAPPVFNPDDSDRQAIQPGFITLLDSSDATIEPPADALKTTGRRTALANWIASPDNPLTARVIVNRVWQQHFGRGLVETSSDFGRLGRPPSHPLLLDYLASRFVRDGWSLKKLHRLILTSATYQQSARRPIGRNIAQVDPDNTLLWRMNPRRLSGEEITDALMTASGELTGSRRAIYRPVRRNQPDELLKAFDAPDRIRSSGKRHRTTSSTQSLLLSNSDWAHRRAELIADRIGGSQNAENSSLVRRAYRSLLGRNPTASEVDLANRFLTEYRDLTPVEKPTIVFPLKRFGNDGDQAIDVGAEHSGEVKLDDSKRLSDGNITVEAFVMLRSLYDDAKVRVIATTWDGSKKHRGWSLGVTSKKSAYGPRNLILQLVGTDHAGKTLHYEVVASDLRVPINKPVYVAASIQLAVEEKGHATFFLRDLAEAKSKLQVVKVEHALTTISHDGPLLIGSRGGGHRWDGLISQVRLEGKARNLQLFNDIEAGNDGPKYVVDFRFDDASRIGFDSSGNGHHAEVTPKAEPTATRKQRARAALIHTLLNSNEMIYVD